MKKSIVSNYLLFCMGFGISMGCIFPVYAYFFVEYHSDLARNLFIMGCLLAGAIVGGLSFLIGKLTIIKAIETARDLSVEIIQTKTLDRQLEIRSQDAIGEFAECFNKLVGTLKEVLQHSFDDSKTIDESISELNRLSSKSVNEVDEVYDQISKTEHDMHTSSEGVEDIRSNLGELSQSINVVASASEELNSSVNEVAKHCRHQSETAGGALVKNNETQQVVESLVNGADQIGEVAKTIKSIAAQTQLLALNASIEAASAGEAGKGFAVVANEIKELSKQTSGATEEIDTLLQETAKQINVAVESMEMNRSVIEEMAGSSNNINLSLQQEREASNEISEQLSILSSNSDGISCSLNQVAESVQGIVTSLEILKESAETTSNDSKEVGAQSQKLAKLVKNLEAVLSDFSAHTVTS